MNNTKNGLNGRQTKASSGGAQRRERLIGGELYEQPRDAIVAMRQGPLRAALLAILPDAVVSRMRKGVQTLRARPARDVFSEIYEKNLWGAAGEKFYSGSGSYGQSAQCYVGCILNFIKAHHIKSVVDLGCGDFAIGKFIAPECERYVGIDIVPSLIEHNSSTFVANNIQFKCLDITKDQLPDADLCLIRQVMQHLSNREISQLLKNAKKYTYVIVAEHQPEIDSVPNIDMPHGGSTRTTLYGSGVYLEKPPFSVPIRQLAQSRFDTDSGWFRIFQLLM
jgi:SAM-dependent methyltransferase